ncbi:MAG: vitamin K epoxide reductase family protein [Candidatus Levybacteria bacterium]|nr:vitamin K epoxide reductase family protein [Candidatus Levybacteria bacterium]
MKILTKPRIILVLIAMFSFLGFLDAVYLTITHYQNVLPPCSLKLGCEKVLTSQFSTIIGIPISLLGSIYYLIVMGLAIIILQIPYSHSRPLRQSSSEASEGGNLLRTSALPVNWIPAFARTTIKKAEMTRILFLLILSGFLVSLILFLIQAFILYSFCQYCLASEVISVFLLIFSVVLIRLNDQTM